ncbi:MAG: undecaprenyl diphosphate synthase family protein [Clostridiales bacterium]|nr:undecaprenyl diphosphate synthase family protein [Clostridiales bacterium]
MYRTPMHIGIIPDGNRRWATQNGMSKEDGYKYGLPAGLELLRAAKRLGIKELTYYGFTVDNCKRPKAQVSAFTDACCKAVKLIEAEGAQVHVVGNTHSPCFPVALLPYAERKADEQNKLRVNLLVNYGWEWDLKNGWLSSAVPRIDLVIRWGGMCRLSGFLPIQTVYSDFYIVDDLWPDFKEQHLKDALDWYSRQDVTLGG